MFARIELIQKRLCLVREKPIQLLLQGIENCVAPPVAVKNVDRLGHKLDNDLVPHVKVDLKVVRLREYPDVLVPEPSLRNGRRERRLNLQPDLGLRRTPDPDPTKSATAGRIEYRLCSSHLRNRAAGQRVILPQQTPPDARTHPRARRR